MANDQIIMIAKDTYLASLSEDAVKRQNFCCFWLPNSPKWLLEMQCAVIIRKETNCLLSQKDEKQKVSLYLFIAISF